MKSATEYWEEKFDEPPQNDLEKLAIAMMAEYADYKAIQMQAEVKVNFAEIIELLELFIAYGMIYTVSGVKYPNGTHKETIDKANKLLWGLRNESKISA